MSWGILPSGEPLDLNTCHREPIHVPGSVQPHGLLLAVREADQAVVQLSSNSQDYLGRSPQQVLGARLSEIFDTGSATTLESACAVEDLFDYSPLRLRLHPAFGGRDFDGILHRTGGLFVIELEPTQSDADNAVSRAQRAVRRAVDRLDRSTAVLDMCARAAVEVRRITGFDRVMVYRFDADWHGEVIAECKRDDLEAFFGLHYPASDIPEQARRLYALNTIRIIPDVDYRAAPLFPAMNPISGEPLDLSRSVLRSVSPIHCEYLRNMGVCASMSISLLRDGKLWGLIACHHYSPKFVAYEVRLASELLGRALSWQIASKEHLETTEQRAAAQAKLVEMVQRMAVSPDYIVGLSELGEQLVGLVNACGVAVTDAGTYRVSGTTPGDPVLAELVAWLADKPDVFATDHLAAAFPAGTAHASIASGVLAIRLAQASATYVIWFRPEVEQTVNWGNDPDKVLEMRDGVPRLSPRGSFSLWKQVVKGRSLPWQSWEVATASEVRGAIVGNVMLHAAEVGRLNTELTALDAARSEHLQREQAARQQAEELIKALAATNAELDQFAYVASHDLKAPLRGIANLSQWVEEDLGESLSGEARENMLLLRGRVQRLEGLIDGILSYSRAGRMLKKPERIDVQSVLRETVELLAPPATLSVIVRGDAPTMDVERVPFEQVFLNLIGNAIKHMHRSDGHVTITVQDEGDRVHFEVTDDGPGIAPEYHHRIWGIFQTLEARDKVEGTGIGLSIVRKTVETRGGSTWVESMLGHGATFHVRWPKQPRNDGDVR